MNTDNEDSTEQCSECGGVLKYDQKHAHQYCEDCGLIPEHTNGYDPLLGELQGSTGLDCTIVTSWRGQSGTVNERGFKEESSSGGSDDVEEIVGEAGSLPPARTIFPSSDEYASQGGQARRTGLQHRSQWGNQGKRKQSREDKCYTVEAFARVLDLPDDIKRQAMRLVLQLKGGSFSAIGAFSALALAALAVTYNQQITLPDDLSKLDSLDNRLEYQDSFRDLAEEEDVDWRAALKLAKKQL